MGATANRYLTRLITMLLSTAAPIISAHTQNYGKVGAVNLDVTATPPGGSPRTLTVGSNIVYKERIVTSEKGSTQILFPDQSTLNVGVNSSLVIDEFYYDPNAKSGTMVASLTKGVLRYIGGQVSHTSGVTINTPISIIGIRGGIATVMLNVPPAIASGDPHLSRRGGQQIVIAHFGTITLRNQINQVVIRQGFAALVNSANQQIGSPFRPSGALLGQIMQSLSSHPGQHGGIGNARVPTENTTTRLGFGAPAGLRSGAPRNGPPSRAHGLNPPGADPLGYTTIFGSGNSAARSSAQTPPPYP